MEKPVLALVIPAHNEAENILTDAAHFLRRFNCADDTAFAMYLVKEVGVTTVPGSSFYAHPELGRTKIRFCFPKTDDMLQEAGRRLQKLKQAGPPPEPVRHEKADLLRRSRRCPLVRRANGL